VGQYGLRGLVHQVISSLSVSVGFNPTNNWFSA
jgi:hypothetical protein